MPRNGPGNLLRRRVTAEPSLPLVTFYDDATGERVELSARTFDNWVAKTANLLVDGLGAQPGDRVVLALPPHWQTAVWLFACWSAGLVAEPVALDEVAAPPAGRGAHDADPDDSRAPIGGQAPYILVAAEEVLPAADRVVGDPRIRDVVGLSLHALGAPLSACPPDVLDYAVEVRAYGDRFVTGVPVEPTEPALTVTNTTFTGAEVNHEAVSTAAQWGLDPRSRVLTDLPYTRLDWLIAGLLAPIASGGSVIIQRNIDKAALDRRISVEHVNAVAGVPGWNHASESVRRLL